MEKQRLKVLSCKITEPFEDLIEKYLSLDTHVTKSDLVRSAIREKIIREAPHLFSEVIGENRR